MILSTEIKIVGGPTEEGIHNVMIPLRSEEQGPIDFTVKVGSLQKRHFYIGTTGEIQLKLELKSINRNLDWPWHNCFRINGFIKGKFGSLTGYPFSMKYNVRTKRGKMVVLCPVTKY